VAVDFAEVLTVVIGGAATPEPTRRWALEAVQVQVGLPVNQQAPVGQAARSPGISAIPILMLARALSV